MESFLSQISEKLQEESIALHRRTETEHKLLAIKTFECMSTCYRSAAALSICEQCADTCNLTMQKAETELEERISVIQSSFKKCMQNCALDAGKSDFSELQPCVLQCTNSAVVMFQDASSDIREIIHKYL